MISIMQFQNVPTNGKLTKFMFCNRLIAKNKLRSVNQDGTQVQVMTSCANNELLRFQASHVKKRRKLNRRP